MGKIYPRRSCDEDNRNPMCPVYWLNAAYSVLQQKPSFTSIRHVLKNDPRFQFETFVKQHETNAAEQNAESDAQQTNIPGEQQRGSLALTSRPYFTEGLLSIEFNEKVRVYT